MDKMRNMGQRWPLLKTAPPQEWWTCMVRETVCVGLYVLCQCMYVLSCLECAQVCVVWCRLNSCVCMAVGESQLGQHILWKFRCSILVSVPMLLLKAFDSSSSGIIFPQMKTVTTAPLLIPHPWSRRSTAMAARGLSSMVPPRGTIVTLQFLRMRQTSLTQMVQMLGKKRVKIRAVTVRPQALRQVRRNACLWITEWILSGWIQCIFRSHQKNSRHNGVLVVKENLGKWSQL